MRKATQHRKEKMQSWDLLLIAQTLNPQRYNWDAIGKELHGNWGNAHERRQWRLTNFCYRVHSLRSLSTQIAQVLKSTVLAMRKATQNSEKRKAKSWDLLLMDGTDTSKCSQLHLNAIKSCDNWGNAHERRQVLGYLTTLLIPRWFYKKKTLRVRMPGSPYPHILGYFKPEIARLINTSPDHSKTSPDTLDCDTNDPFTTTCHIAIAMPKRTKKCVKYYTEKHFWPEKNIQKQLIAPLSRYNLKTQTYTTNCHFRSTQKHTRMTLQTTPHRQQYQKRKHRYLSPDKA